VAEERTETVGDWLGLVHDLYPPAQAHDWDSVGLQVGAADWPVSRVLVTLDVTSAVVAEAAEQPDTLVLAHHPLLFRPLARLTPETAAGRIALAAARASVAVVAAHTNLDVTGDGAGTSDPVARALGLVDAVPLTTDVRDHDQLKLVVFVPTEDTEAVLDALAAAGAGGVGEYERCSFRVTGTGTFRPGPGADPHVGTVGEDAAVTEDRLEVEVPRRRVGAVVAALLAAHPYEEVAYDLYPRVTGADVGIGRVGDLPQPMPLRAVAARVRDGLPAPHTRVAGTPDRLVRRVAVVGGSGMSYVGAARAAGADVLVTGDAKHHEVLDALELGLAVVDAGHHATEAAALPAWVERLTAGAQARGLVAPLVRSAVSTVPWSA
jgi:dinuclear metal center YbgI/SA1388 family protein